MTYNVAMTTTSFALPENWAKDFQVQKRPVILHEVCVGGAHSPPPNSLIQQLIFFFWLCEKSCLAGEMKMFFSSCLIFHNTSLVASLPAVQACRYFLRLCAWTLNRMLQQICFIC